MSYIASKLHWSANDDRTSIPHRNNETWLIAGAGRPRPQCDATHRPSLGIGRGENLAASGQTPAAHARGRNLHKEGQGRSGVILCRNQDLCSSISLAKKQPPTVCTDIGCEWPLSWPTGERPKPALPRHRRTRAHGRVFRPSRIFK